MNQTRMHRPKIQRPTIQLTTAAAFLLIAFTATGCNSSKNSPTPQNFTKALNAHFLDHPDCLLANTRFPFETSDKTLTKQMDSLVAAQLLDKTEEASIHASRYTVAPAGARYAPRFCYGHRTVSNIDTATPLGVVNGFHQSAVTYHYTMEDVPVWAKTPQVLAAFPQMAHAISDQSVAKATLDQTISGWEVPD